MKNIGWKSQNKNFLNQSKFRFHLEAETRRQRSISDEMETESPSLAQQCNAMCTLLPGFLHIRLL